MFVCVCVRMDCREKVTIPSQKQFIVLEGDGSGNTEITFAGHAHASIDELLNHGYSDVGGSATFDSSTFIVLADNFLARSISFRVHAYVKIYVLRTTYSSAGRVLLGVSRRFFSPINNRSACLVWLSYLYVCVFRVK